MQITEEAPIEVTVYRSTIDGALVVQIDTEQDTGRVRVDLNDSAIWDGDPEEGNLARPLVLMVNGMLEHDSSQVDVLDITDALEGPENSTLNHADVSLMVDRMDRGGWVDSDWAGDLLEAWFPGGRPS